MTDIVERLRDVEISIQHWKRGDFDTPRLCDEAAVEIESLREALQEIANIKISPEDGVNKYIVFKARSTARAAIGAKIDE